MKKTLLLLSLAIISLTCMGQKYISDSVMICRHLILRDSVKYTCATFPSVTHLTFSPINNPEKLEAYFPITRETGIIMLTDRLPNKKMDDSTTMVFYKGWDVSGQTEEIVSIQMVNGQILSIGVEDESSLLIFLIKKEENATNHARTK